MAKQGKRGVELLTEKMEDSMKGSVSISQDETLELQDTMGRMTRGQVKAFWGDLSKTQKRAFMFILSKVESYEMFTGILSSTLISDYRMELEGELDRRSEEAERGMYEALAEVRVRREELLAEQAKVRKLEEQVVILENRIVSLEHENAMSREAELLAQAEVRDHLDELEDYRTFGRVLRKMMTE